MHDLIVAVLLALQDEAAAYHNSSGLVGVTIWMIVIGIVMVCLLIIGVLSFSSGSERRNRTRT